eukprot:CAMPEP_0174755140 /NCGR_PEP_ID=MMETSP1094-20130205/106097_1 /TAXON_ID=156173 /ORGANISM="Chrysochromulina brevifilum, Strain UTEX LB 985" /LENGTH=87 /DNA_ID=CAMNT_0015961027 /DNA_START=2468 /DNA_END=2727 /DNA_ORIENTATION=-
MYASSRPSGLIDGEAYSGLPKSTSRGMISGDVVAAIAAAMWRGQVSVGDRGGAVTIGRDSDQALQEVARSSMATESNNMIVQFLSAG